eukprot:CAMPEP_0170555660 /NCGR_PEP_ID=MMETSP0211-20121228/13530_1 /TAXON_ID=311385 /ORGANISM="Pseudokeronopsis sp., Strain OXSARD2" /LENGTH=95 /DNA_ID=CAMNT_0010865623 /DNA_START=707 /DNA_END=994 /DNA_ORIENTATION=+
MTEILTPRESLPTIYSMTDAKRGYVIEEYQAPNSSMAKIKIHLPVRESFGFTSELRNATSGAAFPQLIFDHWEYLKSDPLDYSSEAGEIVKNIRI